MNQHELHLQNMHKFRMLSKYGMTKKNVRLMKMTENSKLLIFYESHMELQNYL